MSESGPIHFDAYGDIVIATVQGFAELDAVRAKEFGDTVIARVAEHPQIHLLLNLHHVNYVSSAGISAIIRISHAAEDGGGSVRVAGVNDDVLTVFEVTNLRDLFHIEQNVQDAAERYVQWVQAKE